MDNNSEKVCTYCSKKIDEINILNFIHYHCLNELKQKYTEEYEKKFRNIEFNVKCCCDTTIAQNIRNTSIYELMYLNDKFSEFNNDFFSFIPHSQNKIKEYYDLVNYDLLPTYLKDVNYIIYHTDYKFLVNPFLLEKICEILSIEIKAEDVYGESLLSLLMKEIPKDDFDSEYINKSPSINFNDFYYQLKDQQQKNLKFRIHRLRSTSDDVEFIITDKSVNHESAHLLYLYYHLILNRKLKYYDLNKKEDLIIFYDHISSLSLLKQKNFRIKQKKYFLNKTRV